MSVSLEHLSVFSMGCGQDREKKFGTQNKRADLPAGRTQISFSLSVLATLKLQVDVFSHTQSLETIRTYKTHIHTLLQKK